MVTLLRCFSREDSLWFYLLRLYLHKLFSIWLFRLQTDLNLQISQLSQLHSFAIELCRRTCSNWISLIRPTVYLTEASYACILCQNCVWERPSCHFLLFALLSLPLNKNRLEILGILQSIELLFLLDFRRLISSSLLWVDICTATKVNARLGILRP